MQIPGKIYDTRPPKLRSDERELAHLLVDQNIRNVLLRKRATHAPFASFCVAARFLASGEIIYILQLIFLIRARITFGMLVGVHSHRAQVMSVTSTRLSPTMWKTPLLQTIDAEKCCSC